MIDICLKQPFRAVYSSIPVVVIICLFVPAVVCAQQLESRSFWNFQLENDLFTVGNDDKHYTNGIELGCLMTNVSLPSHDKLIGFLFDRKSPISSALAISFGQKMFTPDNITTSEIDRRDRPYAGWLFMSITSYFLVEQNAFISIFHSIEYTCGMVGPSSQADVVQERFHRAIGADRPKGWHNQLGNEPGLNLTMTTKWLITPSKILDFSYDISPHVVAALGNIYTYAGAGVLLRIGKNLDDDLGPPNIRPGFPGAAGFNEKTHDWSWYFFAGHESRLMARDIFLDGNTFNKDHHVTKEMLVGDFQFGLVCRYRDVRLSISNVLRTKEFENQEGLTHYGALNISMTL